MRRKRPGLWSRIGTRSSMGWMPVDFGLYSQNSIATSTPSRSVLVEELGGEGAFLVVELEQGRRTVTGRPLPPRLLQGGQACCVHVGVDQRDAVQHAGLSDRYTYPALSTTIAIPCPTPMHIVARPICTSEWRCISCTSVVSMRAPEHPKGCPRAIAPPFGFSLSSSGSIPHSCRTARTWAAKASLSSTRPTSSSVMPARESAFVVAGTGPMPMTLGGTPATPMLLIFASGSSPCALAYSAEASNTAAAPSLKELEFPAVTLPPSLKAGFRLPSFCSEVSRLGPSSASTMVSLLRAFTLTGTISSLKRFSSIARTAFRWLPRAKRSCLSREMS